MPAQKFRRYLTISVLLHVLILLFLFSPLIHVFRSDIFEAKPEPETLVVELQPLPEEKPAKPIKPKEKAFLDTAALEKSSQPDPESLFQSDKNTQASSEKEGQGKAFLPSQDGVKQTFLHLQNTPYSVASQGAPSPPPSPKQEKPKPQQQSKEAALSQKDRKEIKSLEEALTGDDFVLADHEDSFFKKQWEELKSHEPEPAQNVQSRAPPASFSADRRKTELDGNAPLGDKSSIASQETELGRYKAKLYRAIGSRWYLYVQRQIGLLSVGQVRIRFFVRANGVIENPEFTEGDSQSILAALSRRSILDVGAHEPFSDKLKQQLGEGYWEEITFSIY